MNFIEDVLERFPSSKPLLVAITAEGERRVWHAGELIARSGGLSGAFAARGVRRGDVVMTLCGSRIEWVLSMLACWRMGAIALPCNPQLRRHDLAPRIDVARPALCVGEEDPLAEMPDGVECMTTADVAAVLDEDRPQETPAAIEDLAPGDGALIIFTSGTTGEPRGALHTQSYLSGQRLQAEHWYAARDGELAWCTAAPGWSKSSRNSFVAAWHTGAAGLIHDARFDPDERLDVIERERVNVLCQAPTEYRMLARRTELRPLPSVRRLVSAGEVLNPEVVNEFGAVVGVPIHDGYGQTETGPITGAQPGDELRPGSMGRTLPGIEIRLVDGELQLRAATCPTFFAGYLDQEGGPGLVDGEWWATGDYVRRDDDGDPVVRRARRRHHHLLGLPDRPLRGRVGAGRVTRPSPKPQRCPRPTPERGSVVRAIVVLRNGRALGRARPRAPGARQARDRPLQVPAHRRVRRRAAEDAQRQDQAGASCGGR